MFSIQQHFYDQTEACTPERWGQVTTDTALRERVLRATAAYEQYGKGKEYDREKRGLPMAMFMCTFLPNTGAKHNRPQGTWRTQEAVRLNGLFMYDADELRKKHGMTPRELFDKVPGWLFDDKMPCHVLAGHVTPSGDGLRLILTCDPQKGNIADHQQWLGTLLGVPCDESVKDASRGSFMVHSDYILYLDNNIFNYDNETYDKLFGESYRSGQSAASVKHGKTADSPRVAAAGQADQVAAQVALGAGMVAGAEEYRGVKYKDIVLRWLEQNGVPEPGERHQSMLKMAGDLRYICDYRQLGAVVRLAPYVKDWETDGSVTREIDDIVSDVCARQQYWKLPKRMEAVLASLEMRNEKGEMRNGNGEMRNDAPDISPSLSWYSTFSQRMRPLLSSPYAEACQMTTEDNWFGAILATGAMACTLMTRCQYQHYDGELHRMNPQVYIIGDPASGKSFADKLDRLMLAPVRTADKAGREAEARYKKERKERDTSSKAQKGDALQQPETVIRYIPSRTSNAVFYRRLINAKEEVDGELMPLHLYTFDSELDSSITAQSGGSWIGKHDLELKAFHNELSGVDYANSDSVNEIIPVYWNTVSTGTPISLGKKITLRNVNDGLCSRIGIFKMVSSDFRMMTRQKLHASHDLELSLKQWAFRFDRLKGDMPIDRLVEHTYQLCEESAWEAEASSDKVLDYLRKRAVFYAQWMTVPRIVARTYDPETGNMDVDRMEVRDDDLEFASLIYEAVIYWQDYFFGQMLQDSWDNARQMFVQRRRRMSAGKESLDVMPTEFTTAEYADTLKVSLSAATHRLKLLVQLGMLEKLAHGRYRQTGKGLAS